MKRDRIMFLSLSFFCFKFYLISSMHNLSRQGLSLQIEGVILICIYIIHLFLNVVHVYQCYLNF